MSEQEEKKVPLTETLKEIKAEFQEAFEVLAFWGGIKVDEATFEDSEKRADGFLNPDDAMIFLVEATEAPLSKLQALIDELSK